MMTAKGPTWNSWKTLSSRASYSRMLASLTLRQKSLNTSSSTPSSDACFSVDTQADKHVSGERLMTWM
jgi:hypothetical protein